MTIKHIEKRIGKAIDTARQMTGHFMIDKITVLTQMNGRWREETRGIRGAAEALHDGTALRATVHARGLEVYIDPIDWTK